MMSNWFEFNRTPKRTAIEQGNHAMSRTAFWGVVSAIFALASGLGFGRTDAWGQESNLPPEFDLSTQVESPNGHGSAAIRFGASGDKAYIVTVGASAITLSLLREGHSTRLAAADGIGLTNTAGRPLKITVQRRSGRIFVLAGARLIMDVMESTLTGGSASVVAEGGVSATPLRTQPIEPIFFSDDFMRQPTEPGEWTYLTGTWQIQTIGITERGANPFSLQSFPKPTALASAGYPFWSDYSFECAAKGQADTGFGMCVNLQDEHNFYLLRWTSGPKGTLDFVKVVNDKETVLASHPGGFVPGLWYLLGVRTAGGQLIAEVDHQRLINIQDYTFGKGKVGLYSSGTNGANVFFDSILVRPSSILFDAFAPGDTHRWTVEGDRSVGGDPRWDNYTVTADVTPGAAPMGIPIRYRDPANYYLLAWNPNGSSLHAMVNGKSTVLDSTSEAPSPGKSHIIQVGADGGYLWAAVDGQRIVEALDFRIPTGRVGFSPTTAAGKGFRSLGVQLSTAPERFDGVTSEFENVAHHPEMQGWAGPLHAWEAASFGSDSGYWHKGNLYGNTTVRVPLIPQDLQNGQFAVVMNSDGKGADTGYELDFSSSSGAGVSLTLLREGQKVATGHLPIPPQDPTPMLEIRRQGRFLYAGIDKNMCLRYTDAKPLDGYALNTSLDYAPNAAGHSRLGIIPRGSTPLDMPNIEVNNRHVYTETFHLAPVNWRPQSGVWEVTSRWSCQPGWTWYGGHDPGYATNWYKASIWGDQSIDYYAGSKMNAEQNAGTEAWRDLNCALCSDGVNLFSGYTVIIGGWQGKTSRLFRRGKMVAESDSFHFPPQGVAHRLWFDIHIQKQGPRVQVIVSYVDGQGNPQLYPLIDWTDPDPLPGGFVGFWTWDNGIMLARAELMYQQKGPVPLLTADPVWLAREPEDAPYPGEGDAGTAVHDLTPPAEWTAALQNLPAKPAPAASLISVPTHVAEREIRPKSGRD